MASPSNSTATRTHRRVPFSRVTITPEDVEAVARATEEGRVQGLGALGREVEAEMSKMLGTRFCLLTTSCTHALEMAFMGLGVGPGDEVICPSFCFPSAPSAILRTGATLVFADVELDALSVDTASVESKITPRTKAVVSVPYAGAAGDVDALIALCKSRGLLLVEDAAHGLGASHHGKALGTLGNAGCLSFNATKNVVCGEGGALLTDSLELADRCEIIREKGTNKRQFQIGQVGRYDWQDLGSSFVLSDVLAALLRSQLSRMAAVNGRRLAICERYRNAMQRWADRGVVRLAKVPAHDSLNGHIFWMLLHPSLDRGPFLAELDERGVQATFHFQALHQSPYPVRELGTETLRLPNSEYAARSIVRLPLHAALEDADVDYVLEIVDDALSRLATKMKPESNGRG
jgi:dTDP-4-amino-4,6-dideoxygalactose transaminase